MDPMMRLDRAIKILVALFVIVGVLFLGLKFTSRRVVPNSKESMECAAAGRQWDATRKVCRAPG
jgi:hypothetical protein